MVEAHEQSSTIDASDELWQLQQKLLDYQSMFSHNVSELPDPPVADFERKVKIQVDTDRLDEAVETALSLMRLDKDSPTDKLELASTLMGDVLNAFYETTVPSASYLPTYRRFELVQLAIDIVLTQRGIDSVITEPEEPIF